MSNLFVTSGTSGNKLPAEILMKSKVRRFFLMPWIKVQYLGTNMSGYKTFTHWFRPADIDGYSA